MDQAVLLPHQPGRDAANTANTILTICLEAGATLRQLPQQALKLGDPSDPGHGDHGQATKAAQRVTPPSPGPEAEQERPSVLSRPGKLRPGEEQESLKG